MKRVAVDMFQPSYYPFVLDAEDADAVRKARNKRKKARKLGKPMPKWP